jgi:hypothetical protein
MVKFLFVILSLFLVSCGNETFSPTYNEFVCVPAQSIEFLEVDMTSLPAEANNCCENSGIVSCCFGGSHVCADGTTGIGCGCPTN